MSRISPRSSIVIAALLLGVAAPLHAVEKFYFTTRDGMEIKGATFSRRSPDGVAFRTAEGVSKIDFEKLPSNLQKRFRYDPEEAKAYRERKRAAQQKTRVALRKAELKRREERDRLRLTPKLDITLSGTVLQVLPEGVLLQNAVASRAGVIQRKRQVKFDGPTTLSPHRETSYRTVVDNVVTQIPIEIGGGTVFLLNKKLGETALDGQYISTMVYAIGRFHYADKLGNDRTVARFTTEAESAGAHVEAELAKARAAARAK